MKLVVIYRIKNIESETITNNFDYEGYSRIDCIKRFKKDHPKMKIDDVEWIR